MDDDAGDTLQGEAGIIQDTNLVATTGQAIASSSMFMRGHGAYISSAQARLDTASSTAPLIRSSLCGLVRKTNKLISVSALKTRYAPEVGDLVIGRITDLQPGNRRWKVDINSRQDANLLLSSINLPGGIQRRKLDADELEMRNYFKEGDLLVCEVQSIFHDGSTSLHTRSLNYGKLRNGQLTLSNPSLMQRLKSHFLRLDHLGLEIIIGLNGLLWVSMLNTGKINVSTGTGRDVEAIYSDVNDTIPSDIRDKISRMLEIIDLHTTSYLPISDSSLMRGYEISIALAPLDETNHSDSDRSTPTISIDIKHSIVDQIRLDTR